MLVKKKLRLYNRLKQVPIVEPFILSFLPKYKKSLLTQIRSGILPLNIETGRYTNTPVDKRLCTLCNLRESETEEHFICRCLNYNKFRLTLYQTLNNQFMDLPDENKIIYLINEKWKLFVIFLENAWRYRKECLCTNIEN